MPQQESKAKPEAPAKAPEFISEGMRVDIERNGKALDMFTGKWLTQADVDAWNNRGK